MNAKRCSRRVSLAPVAILALFTVGCASFREPTPPESVRPARALRSEPRFTPVPGAEKAMRQTILHVEKLPAVGARLEIRTVVVLPGNNLALPTDHEAVFEVRSGDIETVTDGERRTRRPGDMWLVARGSRVGVRVLGQMAVVRVIYVVRDGN